MKQVIGTVVSQENTGFSPGRFIAENTQQMKLMQQLLEDDNEEGMFVFLDLEKAFDRVSWEYLKKAIARLGFGPDFQKWVDILYKEGEGPKRQIRVNGREGRVFRLQCGTAQGCPLSPLLYLCVMEAFSRMVKADKKVKGIKIGRAELKLSQFADDTVLLLRTFKSINRVWKILGKLEDATGQKVNKTKTEGLLLGALRGDRRAPDWIKWCRDGEYLISLGVPFGNGFEGSQQELDFWKEKYHKTKCIMARWSAIFALTLRGRVMIANSMIYSRFRYWTQCMIMPDEIIQWLEEDIHELMWAKDPHFESGQEGQEVATKRKIKDSTAKIAWRNGGIGLLVWDEHLKSLRKKWVLRYLNHETGAWKVVLDHWMCAGHTLGRGVLISTGETPEAPNEFWKRAVEEFKELKARRRSERFESVEEMLAEPIWESHIVKAPNLQNKDIWEEELGLRQIKDWYDRGTGKPWRAHKWKDWAESGGGLLSMGGEARLKADHKKKCDRSGSKQDRNRSTAVMEARR